MQGLVGKPATHHTNIDTYIQLGDGIVIHTQRYAQFFKLGLAPPEAPPKLWIKSKRLRDGDPVVLTGLATVLLCIFERL